MSAKNKTKKISHTLGKGFLPAVSIMTFAVVGTIILTFSHAATTADNPVGSADYCRLEGSTIAIYGWAHDGQSGSGQTPQVQVKIGTKVVSTWTDKASGKDAAINTYLTNRGIKTGSNYGFKASFTAASIYKGSAPTISGTIINYGVGANQPLNIFAGTTTTSSGSNYYFPGSKVPDACLPAKPAAPVVPPVNNNPNPNPVINNPPPSQNNKSGGSKTGSGSSKVTSGNSTPSTTVAPNQAASTTSSYSLTLKLVNKDQPAPSVEIKLVEADLKITTDDNGNAIFPGLSETSYTVQFDYQGSSYEQTIGVGSVEAKSGSFSQTIDISQLVASDGKDSDTSVTPAHKKSHAGLTVLVIFLIIGGLAGVAFFIIRRRRASEYGSVSNDYSYPLPLPPVVDTTPTYTAPKITPLPTGQPPSQDGAGVSLKEMVIKSMREEAARRKDGQS